MGVSGELEYAINLTEDWLREQNQNQYRRSDPWSILFLRPGLSGLGGELKQHAESIRDGLEQEVQERWPSYSLFELTTFAEIQTGDLNFYEINYRMQEAPEYCVVAVTERIAAAEAWYGVLRSLRAITDP